MELSENRVAGSTFREVGRAQVMWGLLVHHKDFVFFQSIMSSYWMVLSVEGQDLIYVFIG